MIELDTYEETSPVYRHLLMKAVLMNDKFDSWQERKIPAKYANNIRNNLLMECLTVRGRQLTKPS